MSLNPYNIENILLGDFGKIVRDPNKVSIIMTNYNCENLIERAIKSVLNQTYKNIELIIVDDNSTDQSLNIIKKIAETDDRIRVFKNIERKGTYWSKNSVIHKTSGSFITMIDSDDYDLPQKIERQLSVFKDDNIVCVSCSNDRKVSEFSNETEKIIFGYISMMFRYKVFEELGYYDTVNFGGDSELYDRVLLKYGKNRVYHINEVLQISPRRTSGLTTMIPEGGDLRNQYIINYQNWHKTTNNFFIGFPKKDRLFPVGYESSVTYTDLSNSTLVQTTKNVLPIIMCVWKRVNGFNKVIKQLNSQTYKNFKLFVWNNNPDLKNDFSEALKSANFNYEIHHSEKNIGGFARFIFAKKIRRNPNLMDFCVFIDDDQEFGSEILDVFVNEIRSNTILSQWGWKFKKLDYYGKDSRIVPNPGKPIDYAGTGGMVVDMRVFDSDNLYTCPEKYWFVEDLWLSFYANKNLKFNLLKSSVKIKNGDDEHSLYKQVIKVKGPMLVDLVKNYNWQIIDNVIETKYNNQNYQLSVIIPTYNNIEYLEESLNSIINSGKNHNIEILVGIDGCEKTLNYVKQKTYPNFVKFYYFNSNNGPYDVKNTLTKISNSDNIIFFDSDDIMTDSTITEVIDNLGRYDLVRLKYKEIRNNKTSEKTNFHEGAIGINKNLFLSMNGFEPWMCAADSDFLGRLYKRKPRIYHTKNLSMYYRRHDTSLTMKKETGMSSSLRGGYARMSKNKKGDGNPDKLYTRDFVLVDINTIVVDTKNIEYYNYRKSKLDKVLNPVPRKVVDKKITKKDPVTNNRLEILLQNNPEPIRVIKTNKPQDRQELINKKNNTSNTIKELFPLKPNRKEGKNFINFGGKFKG